ncbi:MAG: prephenate dehydrogenase/arogenate dehydrogenase family protein [Alphaproteobacteria bacterium GM202ARS2]|nr:prephenate dehydrogenase/arogenate dehydrogenase family protein [Alphaproteobacteria bacterium GM202ARS2]
MGSSLAKDVRARTLADRLVMVDRDTGIHGTIAEVTAADKVVGRVADVDTFSDGVVLAVPVGQTQSVLAEVATMPLSNESVVTDVGSVKATVVAVAQAFKDMAFVGAHPLAGTEHSGPQAAQTQLFEGRVCVMTPTETTVARAYDKVEALWQGVGMRVMKMHPQEHDRLVALSSHLPHAIAFALAACIRDKDKELWGAIDELSGGGLKDVIRVAASDATMWRDIFVHNRKPLTQAVDEFKGCLDTLEAMIQGNDGDLHDWLSEIRTWFREQR